MPEGDRDKGKRKILHSHSFVGLWMGLKPLQPQRMAEFRHAKMAGGGKERLFSDRICIVI